MVQFPSRALFGPTAVAWALLAMAGCDKQAGGPGDSARTSARCDAVPASFASTARDALTEVSRLRDARASAESDLDTAIDTMECLLKAAGTADPDDTKRLVPALMSNTGTLYAEKARIHRNEPRIAFELIDKAFRFLDKAVDLDPQSLDARINRGIVAANLPGFIGKEEVAQEDLQYVRDSAGFGKLSKPLQETVVHLAAKISAELAKAGADFEPAR